jgi:hypothetical protein
LLCKLRIKKTNLLTVALFKIDIKNDLKINLEKRGWRLKKLPLNPYL